MWFCVLARNVMSGDGLLNFILIKISSVKENWRVKNVQYK